MRHFTYSAIHCFTLHAAPAILTDNGEIMSQPSETVSSERIQSSPPSGDSDKQAAASEAKAARIIYLIPLCLFALSCCFGFLSFLSSENIRSGLTFGGGKIATILASWFSLSWFIHLLRIACGVGILAAFAILILGKRWSDWRSWLLDTAGCSSGWFALCTGLCIWMDRKTLVSGFFKIDDFILIRDAQTIPFWQNLTRLHNDSPQLLLRPLTWLMIHIFGVHPTAYNIALLTLMSICTFTGLRLLQRCGVSRITLLAFLVLFTGWSAWGELTTGYYMLSQYLFNTIAAFLSATALIDWHLSHRRIHLYTMTVIALAGSLINLAGLYIPCGLFALHLCLSFHKISPINPKHAPQTLLILGLTATIFVIASFVNLGIITSTGTASFLSGSEESLAIAQIPATLWTLLGGGILLPTLCGAFGSYLERFGLLWIIVSVLPAGFIILLGFGLRFAKPLQRRILAGAVITLFGISLMNVLGRGFGDIRMFWQVKYTGLLYAWFAFILGLLIECLFKRPHQTNLGTAVKGQLVAALLACFLISQWSTNVAGSHGASAILSGRGYHIRQSQKRKEEIFRLNQMFTNAFSEQEKLTLPVPNGRAIANLAPSLSEYNLSWLTGFILQDKSVCWLRSPMMEDHYSADVNTVDETELWNDIPEEEIKAIQQSPDLYRIYSAPAAVTPPLAR